MNDLRFDGLLIDIDGVLHVGPDLLDGAPEALALLRERRLPFLLVTNTTSRSARLVVERLRGLGLDVGESDVMTPAALAVGHCRARGYERVALHVAPALLEDLEVLGDAGEGEVDAVIVGDLGAGFTYERLNAIFAQLRGGGELVALARNRVWESDAGLVLDAGPFIVALEYALGRDALVMGKPSPAFFAAALRTLDVEAGAAAMIGDDLEADVVGAIAAGMQGILVRTGKFREDTLEASPVAPTLIWPSIAELCEYL